jgi:transposase
MRGSTREQVEILSTLTPDDLVPADHPIRRIKAIVDGALAGLHAEFDAMYSRVGRPSIAPERLLKASLLIALYSVRSERQFCERLQYDMLFKWFLGMNIGDAAFDATTFSKNRGRLLDHEVAHRFFEAVRAEAERRQLLSDDHFTVDGTLLEAWASTKSFRPKDDDSRPPGGRNVAVDFHGQKRRNDMHQSTTDPEARLAKKNYGTAAKPSYAGHLLMENRNGLVVGAALTQASGYVERETALRLLHRRRGERGTRKRWTVAGDKGFDTKDFVAGCRAMQVTPHVAQYTSGRRSAIDERTTRHRGYGMSQKVRKRGEEIFGWTKTVGGGRKLRYIGQRRNEMWMLLTVAMYNVVRMANLELATA